MRDLRSIDICSDEPSRRDVAATGRRASIIAAALVCGSIVLSFVPPASAQAMRDPAIGDQIRTIPADTRLGRLLIGVYPEATIDRQAVRFSAGARIYNRSNLTVPPATLVEPVDVLYRVDQTGQIVMAWVLTPDELKAARRRR